MIGLDQPWKACKCTRVELTIALKAMQADEGSLTDVNIWMFGGGDFSLLAVNVDVTEKGESHSHSTSTVIHNAAHFYPLLCTMRMI